jgi:sugar lactone lactonase YvrE
MKIHYNYFTPFVLFILLIVLANCSTLTKWTAVASISTIAGIGTGGYSGDGEAATAAQLYGPSGVAVDTAGNIYIADSANSCIRKVSTDGMISTVAGTGTAGYSGDGAMATSAQLNHPTGVAIDTADNIYIADFANSSIRKVSTDGTISTVTGTGIAGYAGDGGLATSAQLNFPYSISVSEAGSLYIADSGNNCIRKVSTVGIITTVAGTGVQGFSGDGDAATSAMIALPNSVAINTVGILFIADSVNNRIRKVDASGIITTVAGTGAGGYSGDGGAATTAQLKNPCGLSIDRNGNLFIADRDNDRIRRISSNGTITTVAGTGTVGYSGDGGAAASAQLHYPTDVAVDSAGQLFIADFYNHCIRKVTFP